MPLSKPVARKPFHYRTIQCVGYERKDGLWDIEAQMTDSKSYEFSNRDRGIIDAGDAVHDMWIRLTLDERLYIKDIEAKTDAAPYRICAEANDIFRNLIGLRIKKGWKKTVFERVGGVKGCSHLFELLSPMATTAFQTIYAAKSKAIREGRLPEYPENQRPFLLNSCYAYSENSEVIKALYPKFYRATKDE